MVCFNCFQFQRIVRTILCKNGSQNYLNTSVRSLWIKSIPFKIMHFRRQSESLSFSTAYPLEKRGEQEYTNNAKESVLGRELSWLPASSGDFVFLTVCKSASDSLSDGLPDESRD